MKHNKKLLGMYHKLYAHFGPQRWWPATTRLEIIVGVVLTQNTAWSNVEKAISNLRQAGMLNLPKLSRISEKGLARLIRPAGYYNIKARRLKNVIRVLSTEYQGSLTRFFKLPTRQLRERLLEMNGLGPESADSVVLYAAGKPVFVVDAYTKRIFTRHKLIPSGASYDEIQCFFMDNLPPDPKLYNEYHALIVMTGKHFCRTTPQCHACPLRVYMPKPLPH